jgi:hypothetical protein
MKQATRVKDSKSQRKPPKAKVAADEDMPRELTVQEVAISPLHKDTEFAKRVLDDECYWWLTYAILFENCLKVEGYDITPRSDFSRRNMAIGAWIREHEDSFVLTGAAACAAIPSPADPNNMNEFYDLLDDS